MTCVALPTSSSPLFGSDHNELCLLAERIQKNLDGTLSDLPSDFLSESEALMCSHGWDGEDQVVISSPRYQDDPVLLLARLRGNVGLEIKRIQQPLSKRRYPNDNT